MVIAVFPSVPCPSTEQVRQAIAASRDFLLSEQYPDGYWWSELESNVTITAEVVILHKIWGTAAQRPLEKAKSYLLQQQRDHGGWELYYGDGGELSTSVEAYTALRILGVPATDPALLKAKNFIVGRGGISKSRIFTKMHLALIGCYDWRGTPSIPPWVMLLPNNFFFNIYEMSSWARSSTVPLMIVCDQKPVYDIAQGLRVDELYAEGVENVQYKLPESGTIWDIFIGLDSLFKLQEQVKVVPLREQGLALAEKWILERQEVSGDWGGIIPAMLNSLLALKVLGYDLHDPYVQRGIAAIDNFAVETEDSYSIQACVSPVWDTAWVVRALAEADLGKDHPALVKAGQWLLDKQILTYGDWQIKNPQGKPGAWAFEFDNNFYPDIDDTCVVMMALQGITIPDEARKQGAIDKALQWVATMQCKTGGWAAFDIDNDQDWLNQLPYGDLRAMIDPSTADITARVIEMLGACGLTMDSQGVERGLAYLLQEQEQDGSWFGRWGVNYLYGTSGALSALAIYDAQRFAPQIKAAIAWLLSCQNADGGWGETCESYRNKQLKGKGNSTASQTAWALIGLLDALKYLPSLGQDAKLTTAIEGSVAFLVQGQTAKGTWEEAEFTGTGFPCHFYIRYHYYRQYFPLIALARYNHLTTSAEALG
ncbi:squalene--hopene cyclase [Synechocystis salina]|uniref:Squalene--hopene cyclase n=1 Tax=Synechocystis salina LEGE 00031 TaxID=1828736 RepID=A0ABR9VRM3_9SYNC|nr:squalene--hopene cyclase [Synechocystis salina]MBE9240623.1 squalene--hopene cyclase [Synechocystis salina LEGE 00041]MBE9253977.1 squalene--hopene cyclase [Synechocystis salina LEGE 00031]